VVYLEPHSAEHDVKTKLSDYGLSKREREIALLVIRGLSNRTIAERLFICEQTVKDHLHDIFEKMKIHRRAELAAKIYGLNAEEC
jgi:DNA-binding NarL/FixJ family response regulator